MNQKVHGFTIVELLIVIVIIAILATLSTVVYSGMQRKAASVAVGADAVNLAKQLSLFELEQGAPPTAIDSCPTPALGAICAPFSAGNTARYLMRAASFSPHTAIITKPGYELTVMREGGFVYTSSLEVTNTREFVQFSDLAPIIDRHGMVDYRLSFDIKSASIDRASRVNVYFQNGSNSRYSMSAIGVPVSTEFVRHTIIFRPTRYYPEVESAWLAFYGTYDTGNIPTVRNVRLELAN